ncbi:MAG: hypothetical protein EU531_11145 [Promethearchaeota archaeon]|nr:MAG: hypothetical protein EU531_11145 [Candidatus Lokiarchaeota archaeon]
MDKYERMIFAVVVIIVLSTGFYLVLLFTGFIESKFPFLALIPSWFIILIPIINQKRLEEKKKLNNQYREDKNF